MPFAVAVQKLGADHENWPVFPCGMLHWPKFEAQSRPPVFPGPRVGVPGDWPHATAEATIRAKRASLFIGSVVGDVVGDAGDVDDDAMLGMPR